MTDKCPWYRQGYCVSPLLDQPSDAVTSAKRCLGEYRSCRLYKESGSESDEKKEGLSNFMESQQSKGQLHITELMLPEIYAYEDIPESSCEYFTVSRYDGKYYVYCNKKKGWLTKGQVNLCVLNYKTCPWRDKND